MDTAAAPPPQPLETVGVLIPETQLSAWNRALRLAETLLDLDAQQRPEVLARIQARLQEQAEALRTDLGEFLQDNLTFPPINTARLHSETDMRAQNEQLILALVGTTSPLTRVLRVGELPEFGPLISEAGMNSDVYAFGEKEVVKFVRYGEEAAKLLHDAIGRLADDPRLKDIILPVRMLKEGGAHLLQERIPISYLRPEMQPRLDELVGIAREILHIPNGPDKSIYVGKFRLLIDDQPTNITQQLQWYDPVYLSIRQAER